MEKILERMKKSPLVFDGAMGTMIYERGVFINTCFDELSLSNPKLIRQIHSDYVEAGAEGIGPNTFGANRIALRPAGVFDALHSVLPQVGKPVVVMPNAGFPRDVGGRLLYLTSPEYFTEYAKKYIELGVRGVGGCCGATKAPRRMA